MISLRWRPVALALTFVLASASVQAHETVAGNLRITHAWAAPTPPGAPNAAIYLTIENTGAEADTLIAGSSPASAAVELHDGGHDGDVMRMRPIASIEVPAGGSVAFVQGGRHIMLVGLTSRLVEEGMIELTLTFERAGTVKIDVSIDGAREDHGTH